MIHKYNIYYFIDDFNKDEILKAIDDFTKSVNLFRTQIKQDDLDKIEKFIEEAKAFKEHKL